MIHRRKRVDQNQLAIVNALLAAGCGVLNLSAVGEGCPDILAHGPTAPWALALIEIKNGALSPSRRKLTNAQERLHADWKAPIHVCKTVEEALRAVGVM